MAIDERPRVPRGPVKAVLNFAHRPPPGKKAINYVEDPPEGEPKRNVETDERTVQLTDIRDADPASFNLDRDAFALLRQAPGSSSSSDGSIDFDNEESVRDRYYPEVEALLLDSVPGSTRVHIFDHTVRRAAADARRRAVMAVHIDQTVKSAEQRVRHHLPPSDVDALLAGRYRIINVWRSLNPGPVESNPLAFASSSTLSDDEVIPVEHRYPSGYTGETAAIAYSDRQRWYYASGMTPDERLLLECFDNEALKGGDVVKGGRVAHTAFEDPRSREDAVGRESIEVRALVFGP
jgi:hypothetical protein